jgi:hypothetical protein
MLVEEVKASAQRTKGLNKFTRHHISLLLSCLDVLLSRLRFG